ncbi:MAG TPA: extracellular solute-binding protein [Devosia sp.]|nr:extracellular solute-binding protein [Devosia sp.]
MHIIKRLTLAAAVVAGLAGSAFAQSVDLYHDKANWQDAFTSALGKAPVPVKPTPYADTSTYQAAIRASLKTPSAPGLFTWWSGYRMKDLVDAGLVADVSDIWKKYVDSGKYSAGLANPYTFNGKIYAIPDNIAWWVVFYNKKVFDKYKLTPPKTWEDLEKINATLKQNNVTPFGATIDGRWPAFIWFEEFLIRQDPDLYNKLMTGQAKYTDQGVTDMFAKWKEWIDKGYFTDPSISFGTSGGNTMAAEFAQGKLGMILVGTWYVSTLTGAGMSADDIGAFIMPNEKADMKPALIVESGPILVAANSSQKADALKDADYWMSAEAQQAWVDAQDFPPINKDVKAKSALIADLAKTINGGDYNEINRFWEATPPDIAEAAVDEIANFMVHPDTAAQVQQNLQALADKYWASHKP